MTNERPPTTPPPMMVYDLVVKLANEVKLATRGGSLMREVLECWLGFEILSAKVAENQHGRVLTLQCRMERAWEVEAYLPGTTTKSQGELRGVEIALCKFPVPTAVLA